MPTKYQVNIGMSVETVSALSNGRYSLFGFKAVASSIGGGAPLVWFQSSTFSTITNVLWQTQYQAYTSLTKQIIPGGEINASFSADINLNQTLDVDSIQGTGKVVGSGTPSAIAINNTTQTQFSCGISEAPLGGTPSPLCAFPLYGNGLDVMAPIEKVLLTFATAQINTGTVIEKAYAPGFFIDLTGAPSNTRSVKFDINEGWDAGGALWAQKVAAKESLLPLLIDSSASTVGRLLKA
jgi:hypothetical protein